MPLSKNAPIKLTAISALFVTSLFSMDVKSQEAAEEGRLDIEEIVVTGTKRDVAQQDLAIAVSTITEKQLKNTFRNDVFSLGSLAPNVTLTPQNGFNAIAGGMRGTGFISILVTKDPSVGVVVDDFAFSHVQTQAIEMFDLEQVEIFRGPQGTLFGKNTTGGSINFTTKKPVLGETFADLEITNGYYDSNDAEIRKVNAAVNIPLTDELAFRLSVISDEEEGYWTNSKPNGGDITALGGPDAQALSTAGGQINANGTSIRPDGSFFAVGDGGRIGGKDVLAVKAKLRFEPNDFYRADVTYEYLDDNSGAPATANDTPDGEAYLFPGLGFPGIEPGDDPFVTGESSTCALWICVDRGHAIDVEGWYLTQTFTFDNYTVKSITGIREQDEILNSTYTGEAYNSLYDASRNTTREQFQQEFRISSNLDGPLNYVAGYAMYEDDLEFVVFGSLGFVDLTSPAGTSAAIQFANVADLQATTQDRESSAVYLDVGYEVTDALKVTVGARHTEDEKDFSRRQYDAETGGFKVIATTAQYQGPFTDPFPADGYSVSIDDSKDFEADTYRFVVDYNVNDDTLVYASYATGYVAGGFTETCGSAFACLPYNDEENTNIEVGFKSDLMDGRLRLNAALFQTEYESLQRDTVIPRIVDGQSFQETTAVNEGKSTATGLEIEATYVPSDNFRIEGFLGLLDHEYDEYSPVIDEGLLLTGTNNFMQLSPDLSSLDVPFSPDTTAGLSLTYFQDLQMGGLTYNVNVHHRSEFQLSPFPANAAGGTADDPVIRQKARTQAEERTLVNAYVTWDVRDDVSLTLWGRNLTDEVYRVSANPVGTLWNFTRYGAPRSAGVRASFSF